MIDVNRGAHIRFTTTGIAVYTYVGQPTRDVEGKIVGPVLGAEPGVFYNEYGTEVSVDLAREAGYDVDKLLRERKKAEAIRKVTAQVEEEFQAPSERQVVKTQGDFQVVDIGEGRFVVQHVDGTALHPGSLSKVKALQTLIALAPKEEDKSVTV